MPVTKTCDVCGHANLRQEKVEEVFHLDGQVVMVENMPARVCARCGDATFDRATVEHVRRMVRGEKKPAKRVNMDVFAFT